LPSAERKDGGEEGTTPIERAAHEANLKRRAIFDPAQTPVRAQ
jgi:hypothetical protein